VGARPGKRRLGNIDPDHLRAVLCQRRGEIAGAATKIERSVARTDLGPQEPGAKLERRRFQIVGETLPKVFEVVPDRATVPWPGPRYPDSAVALVDTGVQSRLESAGRTIVRHPDAVVKVAFDSRPTKSTHGVGRYARCLLEALRADGQCEVVENHEPRRCELFHSPWIDGALLRCPVPMVVTVHDLAPLKRHGQYLRSMLRFKLRYLAVQRSTRVIVPTYAVGDAVEKLLEIPQERIAVIPEAPAPALHARSEEEVSAVRHQFSLPERYLVWVGSLRTPEPRKRVAALTRAHRSMPLVLVGPTAPWAHELRGVELTGAVSDDELAAIYTGAHALVFPSDDEGFGLPPVEALACGTPVVACDVPALREVLDGRATFSAVDDLDGLIAAAESAERPAPPAPAWTWQDAAQATLQVYREAASVADCWQGTRPQHRAAALVKDA
jgi:glycosyltransferase involved in cell wall biosynthesis